MKKIIAIGCIAFSFNVSAHAAMMFGVYDCGDWVKDQSSIKKTWLLGYMSGLNSAMSPTEKKDPLYPISANQMYLWMDNYCRQNPLKDMSEGGNNLYIELMGVTKK